MQASGGATGGVTRSGHQRQGSCTAVGGDTGGGLEGIPRHSRIFRMASGGWTAQRIRMRARHRGHSRTSTGKRGSGSFNLGGENGLFSDVGVQKQARIREESRNAVEATQGERCPLKYLLNWPFQNQRRIGRKRTRHECPHRLSSGGHDLVSSCHAALHGSSAIQRRLTRGPAIKCYRQTTNSSQGELNKEIVHRQDAVRVDSVDLPGDGT